MRSLVLLQIGIIAFGAACGRSDLDNQTPKVDVGDSFCHDGALRGAATPSVGFCSDGSHRAPTLAPLAPVASTVGTTRWPDAEFVVDDRGEILDPAIFAIDSEGRRARQKGNGVSLESPAGSLLWSVDLGSAPMPGPGTSYRPLAPDANGTIAVSRRRFGGWSSTVGWIDSVGSTGKAAGRIETACSLPPSDGVDEVSMIRLADGRLAIACTPFGLRVELIDGAGRREATVDRPMHGLASNLAQAPDGTIVLLARSTAGSYLLALDGVKPRWELPLDVEGPAWLAIARDGTIVVRSADALAVVDAVGHLRLRVPAPATRFSWSGSEPTPMGMFVDAGSAVVTWGDAIEARSLVDGSLLWSFAAPSKQHFTYVTAAGPRALYALSSTGELTLLRDP